MEDPEGCGSRMKQKKGKSLERPIFRTSRRCCWHCTVQRTHRPRGSAWLPQIPEAATFPVFRPFVSHSTPLLSYA